jgi:hypothetical protein
MAAATFGSTAYGCTQTIAADTQLQVAAAAVASQEKSMESAKRRVPSVPPVSLGGTRYEVVRGARSRGFNQNGGVLAAVDVRSGKELWTLLVYETRYNDKEEQDVQDVFITHMAMSEDRKHLLIKSESKKSYSVNLDDRSVTVQ